MSVLVNGARWFVDVDGERLSPRGVDLVEKSVLIVLHGSPGNSDHSVFKPQFAALTDVAQVVYVDLLGCGRSDDAPDGQYSLERWADDLVELCDVLGIERPVVLGNSGGGMVAMAYGTRHPDHPGKLILASTQAKLDPGRCEAVFERLGGREAAEVARHAFDVGDLDAWRRYAEVCSPLYNPSRPQVTSRVIPRGRVAKVFHSPGGTWHQLDLLDDLGSIRCPTLVMSGTEDPVTPVEDGEDIAARIDPSLVRFERFENAGHSVWLDDEPAAFSAIRSFIPD